MLHGYANDVDGLEIAQKIKLTVRSLKINHTSMNMLLLEVLLIQLLRDKNRFHLKRKLRKMKQVLFI